MKLLPINRKEVLRYLRYGDHTPDSSTASLIDSCEEELINRIEPHYVYRIFDISRNSDGTVTPDGADIVFEGNDIISHLEGCSKLIMMCCTLTHEADRMIRIAGITDKAKALIYDALANAAAEQVCDRVQEIISEEYPGFYQTSRFSPGYGDFPLKTQEQFLNVLEASRRTGVSLNTGYLMTPMKSVTAVAGLSEEELPAKRTGCISCKNKETCEFRKAGMYCGY